MRSCLIINVLGSYPHPTLIGLSVSAKTDHTQTHVCTHTHPCMCAHTHTYAHTHAHTHTCMDTHTHTVCTYTDSHTHTHTQHTHTVIVCTYTHSYITHIYTPTQLPHTQHSDTSSRLTLTVAQPTFHMKKSTTTMTAAPMMGTMEYRMTFSTCDSLSLRTGGSGVVGSPSSPTPLTAPLWNVMLRLQKSPSQQQK